MKFLDATVAAAAVVATASAAHHHAHEEMKGLKAFDRASLPAAWKNAKIVRAPENKSILNALSRRLSHWMGFNKVRSCSYYLLSILIVINC